MKKEVKNLDGRRKLTGKLIDELIMYYGLAIRRNRGSVEDMRKEIYAALYHKIATDEKPQHDRCPVGENPWCSWQKAKASHTLDIYTHKPTIPMQVFDAVQKIYVDLMREGFFRYLGGFTQNTNESLNAVVWYIAPKDIFNGKSVVDIATNIDIIAYNNGFRGLLDVMSALQLKIISENRSTSKNRSERPYVA